MNRNVVISQSMYFPWVGFLEQISLADIYIQYDDVQFSKGSFTNRVQIKTSSGSQWMTVPLKNFKLGQAICEVKIDSSKSWREQHLSLLKRSYQGAPYFNEMLHLVTQVFEQNHETISTLAFSSQMALAKYFQIDENLQVNDAAKLGIQGKSSQRVLDMVQAVGGKNYVTGHGAHRYLEHALFDRAGVDVEYMQYRKIAYPQLYGAFTPYVSALDLIANCGRQGREYIQSTTCRWTEFNHEST
jgi:hypothetical protein